MNVNYGDWQKWLDASKIALTHVCSVLDRLFEVQTYEGGNHKVAWIYMHRKYFAFEIKACSNAEIAISDVAGILDSKSYKVILGKHIIFFIWSPICYLYQIGIL